MQKVPLEKRLSIVKKNKARLEKALNVSLEFSGKTVLIESEDSFAEYLAGEILDSISLGFDIDTALLLKDTDFMLKKIDIKTRTKSSRVHIVIGRIIGKQGRTKELIEKLSECDIVLMDHIVGIIGRSENVDVASHAIEALIRGSSQSKVYTYLEKSRNRLRELAEEDIEEMIKKEEKKEEDKK
ncbi:MAG: hypothetical protein IB618_00440 [Candidatus Pacearchaeota archaeon]|nr:MAG: hypothetical protein IB618_00440 [Candidatus Pacearchaeota archaeon]